LLVQGHDIGSGVGRLSTQRPPPPRPRLLNFLLSAARPPTDGLPAAASHSTRWRRFQSTAAPTAAAAAVWSAAAAMAAAVAAQRRARAELPRPKAWGRGRAPQQQRLRCRLKVRHLKYK
jgi:hypothetical protein